MFCSDTFTSHSKSSDLSHVLHEGWTCFSDLFHSLQTMDRHWSLFLSQPAEWTAIYRRSSFSNQKPFHIKVLKSTCPFIVHCGRRKCPHTSFWLPFPPYAVNHYMLICCITTHKTCSLSRDEGTFHGSALFKPIKWQLSWVNEIKYLIVFKSLAENDEQLVANWAWKHKC